MKNIIKIANEILASAKSEEIAQKVLNMKNTLPINKLRLLDRIMEYYEINNKFDIIEMPTMKLHEFEQKIKQFE